MRVWRVCKRRHTAFDGQGARMAGGRWNHPGTAIVYTYETLSLATLELFVQLGRDDVPDDMVVVSAEIPPGLGQVKLQIDAPQRDWRLYPSPTDVCNVGTRWVADRMSAVLVVPSAVIPGERAYLLNPAHPAFREIHVYPPEPFELRSSPRRTL